MTHQWHDIANMFEADGHDDHPAHDGPDRCLSSTPRNRQDDKMELCVYHLYMVRDHLDDV